MLRSLNSGISALQQFQQELDVIGNNIANVNTTGFKSATVDFADALSQTVGTSGGGLMQVGTGVRTDAITNQFIQGTINSSGSNSSLAISGNGFFVVRDPASGAQYATRAGNFQVDTSGYLVTTEGLRVQGYQDAGLTTMGDVRVDNTGAPGGATGAMTAFTFDKKGNLTVTLDDGTEFTRGQVLLQNFRSPQNLVKEGSNLFSNLALAGGLGQPAAAGTNGLGTMQSNALEASNVDLTVEISSLITTQRAYEASAHVITTSDQILQDLVNIKR
jgi:flagellar hook protein FlgE